MADAALMLESALTSAPTRARKVSNEVLRGPERRRRWSFERSCGSLVSVRHRVRYRRLCVGSMESALDNFSHQQ